MSPFAKSIVIAAALSICPSADSRGEGPYAVEATFVSAVDGTAADGTATDEKVAASCGVTATEGGAAFADANHRAKFPAFDPAGGESAKAEGESDSTLTGPAVTTVCSLAIVLAVFGVMVWVSRRFGGAKHPSGTLPTDVFQNLGSAAIDSKTRVTYLKIGQRIVVVGQTQSGDPQTLAEVTDSAEVERITGRCLGRPEIVGRRSVRPHSVAAARPDLAAG